MVQWVPAERYLRDPRIKYKCIDSRDREHYLFSFSLFLGLVSSTSRLGFIGAECKRQCYRLSLIPTSRAALIQGALDESRGPRAENLCLVPAVY